MTKKPFRPSKHVLGDRSITELQAIEEEQFENSIVKYLFARFRLNNDVKFDMLRQEKDESGVGKLTFAAFFEEFPTFPIYLWVRKIRKIKEDSPLNRWFSDFARRAFTKKFYELCETEYPADWEGPVGLVFNWPNLSINPLTSGKAFKMDSANALGLVIHNGPMDLTVPGVRVHWKPPKGETLTVEPLPVLFNALKHMRGGREWRP